MKKSIKVFIALTFIISILCHYAISVFADSAVDYDEENTSNEPFYSIDIIWDDVSFEFSDGMNIWNPNTHEFDIPNGKSMWVDDKGKVTVQNHSNVEIDVLLTFEQAANPNGTVILLLDNASFKLAKNDGNTSLELCTNSCNIRAEGIAENSDPVGKITVAISSLVHIHIWNDGVCTDCKEVCPHRFEYGVCIDCGKICQHNFVEGICGICGCDMPYTQEGKIIYFGEYPQTLKATSVTVSTITDSRGYFLGSDNAYYAKVTATPYASGYQFSTNETVSSGTEYYFKVEPLKWRIISESNGIATLICESIIDNLRYDDANNNYKTSEVRAWLNGDFYNKAFETLEKNLIQTVLVDNSAASTGYSTNSNICENTNDKIYLLSYADVTNSAYGFASDDSRIRFVSDFARARGAWISKSGISGYYGAGLWMLRSPNDTYTHFIRECSYNGEVSDGGTSVTSKFYGVVPALKIKL